MSRPFVIGYDGSPASRAAVDLAVRLARPGRARIVAVTGDDPADPHVPGVDHVTVPGNPVAALCGVAEREHAAMIVVGATHLGALGRITPGSTAELLLHGAPCAVAVAPSEADDRPIGLVGIAYDGSAESTAALITAEHLARAHDAALRVLTVCTSPWTAVDLPLVAIEDPAYDRAQADMVRLVAELPRDLHATGDVLAGRPGHTLVDACADGVDLLVAGSRSYGPLVGALVGSVSRHLVDHAPCPVVIVPRGVMPDLSPPAAPHSSAAGTGR